jgi:hypothetical protein
MRKLYGWILGKFRRGSVRVFNCSECGQNFETLYKAIQHCQFDHPGQEFTVDI